LEGRKTFVDEDNVRKAVYWSLEVAGGRWCFFGIFFGGSRPINHRPSRFGLQLLKKQTSTYKLELKSFEEKKIKMTPTSGMTLVPGRSKQWRTKTAVRES
jgi:hypothetical protein